MNEIVEVGMEKNFIGKLVKDLWKRLLNMGVTIIFNNDPAMKYKFSIIELPLITVVNEEDGEKEKFWVEVLFNNDKEICLKVFDFVF